MSAIAHSNVKAKILLVDDRKENLIALEQLLNENDRSLEFIKATNGQDALRHAFFEDLALILLDVQMPDMDGYEVARLLKSNSKTQNIPIIFVTASNQDTESVLVGYETGAIDYLFKPLNPSLTKAKVRSFIRMYLQQKEVEHLTNLVNNSLDLMCILDAKNLKIVKVNPAWESLGYNTEELQGQPFYSLVSCKDDQENNRNLFNILHESTKLSDFESCVLTKQHERKYILWSFVLKDDIWYCNGKEYTERKIAEEQLQVAQHSLIRLNTELEERVKRRTDELRKKNDELRRINTDLDNFIYTASHDLKAPISNIEGLMGALDESCNDTDETRNLINMIHQSVDRFKMVINELTDLAKVQSEDLDDEELLSFDAMFADVKNDIQDLIENSEAIITEDFSKVPSIKYSKKNLRSILYNLISNAIKYRAPERLPEVNLRTYKVDNCIVLSVEDNGLGIKEEDKPKVFSMFKRLHDHVEGTGIGLSLVKRIVENNGGKIEVESKVGAGSIFKIFF